MRNYSSVASSKVLDTTINSSTTSMIVNNTTGFPATPFTLVIEPDTANEEIVLVTGILGTTLTIQRGATTVDGVTAGDGTLGKAHDAGAVIKHMVTARDLQEPQNHMAASTNVHGLAGGAAVVGTTTTQTLENKTIGTGSSIASSVTAVTQSSTDNSTKIATTAFVKTAVADTTAAYTYMYSNSTTTSSASSDIAFTAEAFDTANAHSTTVDNWKWLPTVAGTYSFSCVIALANATSSSKTVSARMVKNSTSFGPRPYATLPANSESSFVLNGIASFNGTTDYAKVTFFGDTSGNVTYQAYWTITRLGD